MKNIAYSALCLYFFGAFSCGPSSPPMPLPASYKIQTSSDLKKISTTEYRAKENSLSITISNKTPDGIGVPMCGDFPYVVLQIVDGQESIMVMHRKTWRIRMNATYIPWFFPVSAGSTKPFRALVSDLVDTSGDSVEKWLENRHHVIVYLLESQLNY